MNRDQFLKERMVGIGGSDAAPILLGSTSYRTALDVYLEKRGEVAPDVEETDAQRFGRLIEPVLREEYARRHGCTVEKPTALRRHPKHEFVIGNPDGLVIGEKRGWEGKTARTDNGWGEPGTDQIPQAYLIQVQHYMLLEAIPVWDVSVLIGGQDYREYEVPADRELHEMILDAEAEFWQRVQRGDPPAPDFTSPLAIHALKRLYPGTNGETIIATPQQEAMRMVMEEAIERAKVAESTADGAKAMLLWDMGENALMKFNNGTCLRRKQAHRKAYCVGALDYIDARIVKDKE